MKRIVFRNFWGIPLLLAGILLASCSPTESPVVVDPSLPATVAQAAQDALARELNIDMESIEIVETEAVEWPDACLGIATEGVACAQVITPGFRLMLEVNGQTYEVHTNEDGSNVEVIVPPAG